MQRMFITKCFLFTVGNACCVKLFYFGGKRFADEEVEMEMAEVAVTRVKMLLGCGFPRAGKAMEQLYRCWWRIIGREIIVYSRFEYHIFYVLYSLVTYLLNLPLMSISPCVAKPFLHDIK
jgi:hypothetical protein